MPAARTQTDPEMLVRRVETTIGKLADPGLDIPLPVIQRLERALHLGHRTNLLRLSAMSEAAMDGLHPQLTEHQLDTLRLYEQLGSYAAVADYVGVTVDAVEATLTRARVRLRVTSTAEAIACLPVVERAS